MDTSGVKANVMDNRSDEILIDSVIGGEKEAFRFLVERHKNLSYSLALKIVREPMHAEEVAQEAFIKAYRSLKLFNRKSKFSTWLFRIVYTTAISFLRKEKKYIADDILDHENDAGYEETRMEGLDRKVYIKQALAKLPPDDASAVTLFYLHQYSLEEVAEVMGQKANTVKVKIHRARKKMAVELAKMLKEEVVNL